MGKLSGTSMETIFSGITRGRVAFVVHLNLCVYVCLEERKKSASVTGWRNLHIFYVSIDHQINQLEISGYWVHRTNK